MYKPSSCKPLQERSLGSCIHSANTSGVRYLSIWKKTHASLGRSQHGWDTPEATEVPADEPQASETSRPRNRMLDPVLYSMEKAESTRKPELLAIELAHPATPSLGLG